VATGVAPESSFCFFNEVHELVLPMIACYFAFGHETPEQRQILAHAKAVGRRGGGMPVPPGWPEPANRVAESCSRHWVIRTVVISGVTGMHKGTRDLA
jgi:hypothetical protein